jgi:hypothetical protein
VSAEFAPRLAGENRHGLRGLVGDELLGLTVRTGGISLGRSVELVLDLAGRRALGLDVDCGDAVRRFLPLAVTELHGGELVVASALVLLDETERRFYRERGITLGDARALTVQRGSETLGPLRDVVLGRDSALVGLLVRGREHEVVPFDASIAFRDRRMPAA